MNNPSGLASLVVYIWWEQSKIMVSEDKSGQRWANLYIMDQGIHRHEPEANGKIMRRRWSMTAVNICVNTYLFRQVTRVLSLWGVSTPVLFLVATEPERPLVLLLISRLISIIGSTVLVMFPQRSHLTSLCNWPEKVEWTTQLQDTLVDPLEVEWIWFNAEMKNSWASCCAWPESSVEAFHVVVRKLMGPYGAVSSE